MGYDLMLASEFISKLQALMTEHGDLTIENEYGNLLDDPEFNDDDNECFLVSFDEADSDF